MSRQRKKRRCVFHGKSSKTCGENQRSAGQKNAGGDAPAGTEQRRPDNAATEAIVKLAVESWRFIRVFEHAMSGLGAKEAARYRGFAGAFGRKIEAVLAAIDMRMVSIEGTAFDPGIAATPLNIGDFEPDDELEVDAMIEPIIMNRGGLVRMGSVTLRKMKT